MEEFDFEIEHRPGRLHGNADALSRVPCRQCGVGPEGRKLEDDVTTKRGDVRAIFFADPEGVADSPWRREELARLSKEDPDLGFVIQCLEAGPNPPEKNVVAPMSKTVKALIAPWKCLELKEGVLYRLWENSKHTAARRQLVPPAQLRAQIVEAAHSGMGGSHLGVRRTRGKVQEKAYWVGWSWQVQLHVLACPPCATYHRGQLQKQGPMQDQTVGEPWERLSMDITGPHPRSRNGFIYIMTVMDLFSKYAFAFPIRNHEATTVVAVLMDKVFLPWGAPLQLLRDRGPEFEGSLMKRLCEAMGVDKLRTTSYKPTTNGGIERFHRSLNTLLAKSVTETHCDWDEWVPTVMSAYNSSPHSATGLTPNYLRIGREIRLPLDLVTSRPEQEEQ